MSRTPLARATTVTGLTFLTAAAGLALAPTALAAPAPAPVVAPDTVVHGQEFVVSGTSCDPGDEPNPNLAYAQIEVEGVLEEVAVDPAADGTWAIPLLFLEGTPTGTYTIWTGCVSYDGTVDNPFPDTTITLKAAATPTAPPTSTPAPAPAPKVVEFKNSDHVVAGKTVTMTLTGFKPHELVTAVLHSTPQHVGTFRADATGTVVVTFTVPAGTTAGMHSLVLTGDQGTVLTVPVEIAAATPVKAASSDQLAYTGADIAVPLAAGLGLVVLGAGTTVLARRRNAGAEQA